MTGTVVTVGSATALKAALNVAELSSNPTTINLLAGDYGDVFLKNLTGNQLITVKSADPQNEAVFDTLRMNNVHNLLFQGFEVDHPLEGAERTFTPAVSVQASSSVTFVQVDVHGSMDGNASNDGVGIAILASSRISVLDSTFEQLCRGITITKSEAIAVAGNDMTGIRQGVTIAQVNGALFEKNYTYDMQPDYDAGDHPDHYQVLTGGSYEGSNNLTFRSNVMIEGTSDFIGGIYVQSERRDEGVLHSNINVENNFYHGNYRHALSFSGVRDLVVRGNSIVNGDHYEGPTSAIYLKGVRTALVEDNVTPLIVENRVTTNLDVTQQNNVDTWDPETRRGHAEINIFAPLTNPIDITKLVVRSGSIADEVNAGFVPVSEIGNLTTSASASHAKYSAIVNDLFAGLEGRPDVDDDAIVSKFEKSAHIAQVFDMPLETGSESTSYSLASITHIV